MRRFPSTIGPVVVLLMAFPARTLLRRVFMNAIHAGLITASPGTEPATGLRQAVAAGVGPTGRVPVVAGEATCVVSYAWVGAITDRCWRVARIASGWYW